MLNERQKQRLGVGFLKTNEVKLWSEATPYSMFNVGRSMFDVQSVRCSMFSVFYVGRSSFKQSVGFQEKHAIGCAAPKLNAVAL